MPFSFRLDSVTATKIRRLAKDSGMSRSDVVREAVARYGEDPGQETTDSAKVESALDRFQSFAGIISTNGAQLSKNTHEKYRRAVQSKHRGRRPR